MNRHTGTTGILARTCPVIESAHPEPDVAIVDLLLPGIDGWELVSTMRDAVPECPVVIVSVLEERRFPPGVPSLPKPFTRDQLLAALEQAVPGRRWS